MKCDILVSQAFAFTNGSTCVPLHYGAKKFATRWMVYHERVQTTSVFVRDCSTVTPYQLLLFGGKIAVQHAQGTLSLDRWATFKAPPRVGVLLKVGGATCTATSASFQTLVEFDM
jgi:hypothetical protein